MVINFIIAFVALIIGILGTRLYDKQRFITLINTNRREMNETNRASYRTGWDAGVDFGRRHHKRKEQFFTSAS